MIIGGYVLHLYCDVKLPLEEVYTMCDRNIEIGHVQTRSQAEKEARLYGWRFSKVNGTAICPRCLARGFTLPEKMK